MAYIAYAILDLANDCLLIPGRAMVEDSCSDEQRNWGNSLMTAFQSLGRLTASLTGAFLTISLV
jgi:hypothetical protein